jgi:hypothetical protein
LVAGQPNLAAFQLKNYVSGIANHRYVNPRPGGDVEVGLIAELRTAYKQMTPDVQQQLRDAVAVAKATNPDAWISKLDFSLKK